MPPTSVRTAKYAAQAFRQHKRLSTRIFCARHTLLSNAPIARSTRGGYGARHRSWHAAQGDSKITDGAIAVTVCSHGAGASGVIRHACRIDFPRTFDYREMAFSFPE